MTESLRPYFSKAEPAVTINARVFPYLDEIAVNFDGAEVDGKLPPLPSVAGETKSACEAAIVTVGGRNVNVLGAPVNIQVQAHDVVFHSGRDENGEVLLLLHNVRTGQAVISASELDLENAVRIIVQEEGQKHGISVEQTRVALRARGSRSLAADVRLRARKFLLRANIDIAAQVDIEPDFSIKLSNLKCRADGMLGTLACDLLNPHLRKLEGRKFPVMPLLFGEIRLHDVRIAVADTVEITADFGAASV